MPCCSEGSILSRLRFVDLVMIALQVDSVGHAVLHQYIFRW